MPMITLPAHYDGERICLDEDFDLKPETKLIVTILPEEEEDDERNGWLRLSGQSLKNAYGDNEPDYPASLIKEPNPTYGTS
ncbi:MAG: hypothetical protein GY940_47375 [bacterium]|nr:hypothetical protein [bacterium]